MLCRLVVLAIAIELSDHRVRAKAATLMKRNWHRVSCANRTPRCSRQRGGCVIARIVLPWLSDRPRPNVRPIVRLCF